MKVIKLQNDDENLTMFRCDDCGCTLRFGFVVDDREDCFRIIRIVCGQCGMSIDLDDTEDESI